MAWSNAAWIFTVEIVSFASSFMKSFVEKLTTEVPSVKPLLQLYFPLSRQAQESPSLSVMKQTGTTKITIKLFLKSQLRASSSP
jgi:hypothetical protein